MEQLYDLASLTKALCSAPLALKYLHQNIDDKIVGINGFPIECKDPFTLKDLLCHRAGLPAWLPFRTDMSLYEQIVSCKVYGQHALISKGIKGTSLYSDISFRFVKDLLESNTMRSYEDLAVEQTGLYHYPWSNIDFNQRLPISQPNAVDEVAWHIYYENNKPIPDTVQELPHDINARAGMKGHAGLCGSAKMVKNTLKKWVDEGYMMKQAVPYSRTEKGQIWGLGLWVQHYDVPNGFYDLLHSIPINASNNTDVHIIENNDCCVLDDTIENIVDISIDNTIESDWWSHSGFTGFFLYVMYSLLMHSLLSLILGPTIFVRPKDRMVICVLCNRLDVDHKLLDNNKRKLRILKLMKLYVSEIFV